MSVAKKQQPQTKPLEHYLHESSSIKRVQILREISQQEQYIPCSLVDDLLLVDLPINERLQLLKSCDRTDLLAFEDVMTRGSLIWEPNIAAVAIREWAKHSNHLLWWRFPDYVKSKPAQRVLYTLLDTAAYTGGEATINAMISATELDEISFATLAMTMVRSTQWNIKSEKLIHFAEQHVVKSVYAGNSYQPLLSQVLEYLAMASPKSLDNLVVNPIKAKLWDDVISAFRFTLSNTKEVEKDLKEFVKKFPADHSEFYLNLFKIWPPAFHRNSLSADTIASVVDELARRPIPSKIQPPPTHNIDHEFFGGISSTVLLKIAKLIDAKSLGWFLQRSHCYFPEKNYKDLAPLVKNLEDVPDRIAADLNVHKSLSTKAIKKSMGMSALTLDPKNPDFLPSRQLYLSSVYTQTKCKPLKSEDAWTIIHKAYLSPDKVDRNQLKVEARKIEQVFAPAIFRLVEKFSGCDDLLPLLLDSLHSEESDTLLSVSRALVGVGSDMAMSHFIKILGNTKVSAVTRVEMCGMVTADNMTKYQHELREMAEQIRSKNLKLKAIDFELIEALRDLMSHQPMEIEASTVQSSQRTANDSDVDAELEKKLPCFNDLHPESKRAFRTAWIIQSTIHSVAKEGRVDISPVVDLQFKGLEILFRKKFEGLVYQLVQDPKKILQRKLDALGYLRPSQDAMNAFENYISSLPVVRDIPQFSRYKLNRVLRAIANFRPGRRFTVEGIKGYAFIFLAFGRKDCRHGLENILPLNTSSDEDLANLCRDLHIYQDIRNQAVHEGLPPHMIGNIDGYWNLTASILTRVIKLVD